MLRPENFLNDYGEYLQIPGVKPEESGAAATALLTRYTEPWRKHHNLDHLVYMAEFLDENSESLQRPTEVFIAVIGHDAMYVPSLYQPGIQPGINEALSGILTQEQYAPFLGQATLQKINRNILSIIDHAYGGSDTDQAFILDADMGILGSSPEVFDEYDANIQKEFNFIEPSAYRAARLAVLKTFASSESLFITDAARLQFGNRAKENLERTIAKYEQSVTT